jgi:ubiquinol-cytochrome c reductase cytochrome b subunit
MFSRMKHWIDERWPLNSIIHLSLEEQMVGGTSYAYVFGSCVLAMFLLQAVTGVWQLLYFVPVTHRAYDSLNYLRLEVPFGWLIHNLHYWGASAMIILLGLHISQVFIWGAYKDPRQLTWLIGVGQLLLTLALGFTGPVLPWDERGYWEAEVGASMSGTVPFLGGLISNLFRGGDSLGQLTLSRFFFLHIAILPVLLMTLILLHIVAFRKSGISGPWEEKKRKVLGPFWPDQVLKDAVVITLIFVILVGLSAFARAPFSGPFDIMQTFYTPKPEWYFLFLYQTLKAFPGRLEPIGTAGIPLVVISLFLFLPFIDRSPERNPTRRRVAMGGYLIFVGWVMTMAIVGYYSKPGISRAGDSGVPSSPAVSNSPTASSEGITRGFQLFNSLGCIGCHKIKGRGGTLGPELSPQVLRGKSREWLVTQIRDPKMHQPDTIMPAFTSATDQQVSDVIDFLMSVAKEMVKPVAIPSSSPPARPAVKGTGPHKPPGPGAFAIGNTDLGEYLFKQHCTTCHGPGGKDEVPNPGSTAGKVPPLNPVSTALFSKDAEVFVNNIDRYIQHGSVPRGPNPALRMLPFGDSESLTQQMIANIEAYVLSLNGVDRAQIVHPGIEPHTFFWLVVAFFALVLGGFWVWKGRARGDRPSAGPPTASGQLGSPSVTGTTRRGFLEFFVGVLSSLVALTLLIPMLGTLIGPSFRKRGTHWAKVGDIAVLSTNQPVSLDFPYKREDAYIKEMVIHSVWVIKHSPSEVTVFSPICPHLGCHYDWHQDTREFACPCHGSIYSMDGKVLGGPAPRPLDTLPWKVQGGELYVKWERFRVGIPGKVRV